MGRLGLRFREVGFLGFRAQDDRSSGVIELTPSGGLTYKLLPGGRCNSSRIVPAYTVAIKLQANPLDKPPEP